MFTRRKAIRWAELWLSCWNDRDYDTLLAMHKDDTRFGGWNSVGPDGSRLDQREAMKRHWAAIPSSTSTSSGSTRTRPCTS